MKKTVVKAGTAGRKAPRGRRGPKALAAALALLVLAGGGAGGYLFLARKRAEEARRAAEMERQRKAEAERRNRERLLAEKRAELDALIADMEASFRSGRYGRVRELAEKARALAKEFGFPTERIDGILSAMETALVRAAVERLEKRAADPFSYLAVRRGAAGLSAGGGLGARIRALRRSSERNEYLVCLHLAEKSLDEGISGVRPDVNYELGRTYYDRAVSARTRFGIPADAGREAAVMRRQNGLFFAARTLRERSVPTGVY